MGNAIAIGPLMLAVDRGLAVLCVSVFLGLTALAGRFRFPRVSAVATSAIVVGLVTARISYVAAHWTSYADAPLSILAVWQGGFAPAPGLIAAAGTLAFRLGRTRALAIGWGALAIAGGLWFTLQALIPPVTYGPFPYHLALTTPSGAPLPLDRFRGRPFVINLWATWCGPCRRELPMLDAAASRYQEVPILLADQGEAPAIVKGFLSREGIGASNVALDPARELSQAFEVAGYPATAFVAADGTIVQLQLGELSRAALADGIDMARKHR
ncbi:TlpA disulfide reductase family protein [Sphingobium fuliginis]|jgi:cytochrome c biogenesis protein CcmG/thiol:disulfide interchange protein DsbE|uniref:TlpA family protein disulfide reductase n=2 Tax=Sphingobium yanoikuyae TaxID=13690 RepID=A0A6M4GI77_SPHYA|nr:TlpA family protein disulfide reductase [Sphingobium yanoikuyae]